MSLLTASLDDIVFEGRNQAYGAYQLRQEYQNRLSRAGSITLGLCALLLGSWAFWPAPQPQIISRHPVALDPIQPPVVPVIEKPVVAPSAPVASQAASQPAVTHAAASVPTRVVQDNQVLVTPPDIDQLAVPDGPVGPPATAGPGALVDAGGPGGGPGGTDPEAAASTAPAKPFEYVEKMPEFAGGQAALLRYLRDHLRYPSQALRQGQEGRVFMSFVVGADGNISSVEVMKGLGYGLDEEALRVVRQMPTWTPGYQAHHAVPVRFTLPITFRLQ